MIGTLSNLAKRIFGDSNQRELNKLQPLVEAINGLEPQIQALSDEQLATLALDAYAGA